MGYRTVFEITQSGLPWWILSVGLVIITVGVLFFLNGRRTPRSLGRLALGVYAIAFGVLITAITFLVIYGKYRDFKRAYAAHRYSEVEGRVENFVPMPPGGHADESFTVRGVRFSYSGYDIDPCFHKAAAQGGPVQNGVHVRIFYVGNCIVRLDVQETGTRERPR